MLYRKILCAVDFSESSRSAVVSAIEQVVCCGGSLTLAHIVPQPATIVPEAGIAVPLFPGKLASAAEKTLETWRQMALQLGAPHVEAIVAEGVPWTEIVALAARGAYDLIVIGTNDRTGLKHALLGSVAEKVMRHAKCPVLVVRLKGLPSITRSTYLLEVVGAL